MNVNQGDTVAYTLTADDAKAINMRRNPADGHALMRGDEWPDGAQAHIGNAAKVNQKFPAIVVVHHGGGYINAQVFLDGNDVLWVTHVPHNRSQDGWAGTWHWPMIPKPLPNGGE